MDAFHLIFVIRRAVVAEESALAQIRAFVLASQLRGDALADRGAARGAGRHQGRSPQDRSQHSASARATHPVGSARKGTPCLSILRNS